MEAQLGLIAPLNLSVCQGQVGFYLLPHKYSNDFRSGGLAGYEHMGVSWSLNYFVEVLTSHSNFSFKP